MIVGAIAWQLAVAPVPPVEPGRLIPALLLEPETVDARPRRESAHIGIVMQKVVPAGRAQIMLSKPEAEAYAARNGVNLIDFWNAVEWAADSRSDGTPLVHREFLFCREGGKLRYQQCLRDTDRDGRFEAKGQVVPGGLVFTPIEPVAYRFGPALQAGQSSLGPFLRIMWDRATDGRLAFYTDMVGDAGWSWVRSYRLVDPAQLPTRIELFGAQILVQEWDGKRPTISIERAMTEGAFRLVQAPVANRATLSLRAEMIDGQLPPRLAKWPKSEPEK